MRIPSPLAVLFLAYHFTGRSLAWTHFCLCQCMTRYCSLMISVQGPDDVITYTVLLPVKNCTCVIWIKVHSLSTVTESLLPCIITHGFYPFIKGGLSLSEEKDFVARLHIRNTGVGTIHLTAKCPLDICSPDGATFSDQVLIQVFPPLKVLHPQNGHFLLPHQSSSRIMTNRYIGTFLHYFLLKEYSKHMNK